MDELTLEKLFEDDAGTQTRVESAPNLTPEELTLYNKLKQKNWCLKQEKIPFDYVNTTFG